MKDITNDSVEYINSAVEYANNNAGLFIVSAELLILLFVSQLAQNKLIILTLITMVTALALLAIRTVYTLIKYKIADNDSTLSTRLTSDFTVTSMQALSMVIVLMYYTL